jgi:predicted ribosomally synthesized peptide with nif11-like leader
MELTNAKALLAKIVSDPEVAKIFSAIKTPEDFLAEAKKLGYSCTLEEFVAAKKEGLPAGEGAMSDDELAQTSGGLSMVGVDYAFTAVETAIH